MSKALPGTAESFITNLTGADVGEIKEYTSEFRLDERFQKSIEAKKATFRNNRYLSWGYGIGDTLGLVLYIICRRLRPDNIVETGVASGVSSAHILGALEQNKKGQLYSIDLPGWQKAPSGWLIPDYLRHRWHLLEGKSSEKLGVLLPTVSPIDIFLHDSDHSYQNMLWEFQTAWKSLKSGGLLLAHNIDYNEAFADFSRDQHARAYYLEEMGGIAKA